MFFKLYVYSPGIPLGPKEKLDIPVLFAPDTMKLYEALVVVNMVKANGNNWEHNNVEDLSTELKRQVDFSWYVITPLTHERRKNGKSLAIGKGWRVAKKVLNIIKFVTEAKNVLYNLDKVRNG